MIINKKPLGCKSYGSIPHISFSKLGNNDHRIHEGQENILFKKTRNKYDNIVITEKLDGANVAVTKIDGCLYPMTRAGNKCELSTFQTHKDFNKYVFMNYNKFDSLLEEKEQISGEWLSIAHGLLYDLRGVDPFVVFDLFTPLKGTSRERYLFSETLGRIKHKFNHVPILYSGSNAVNIGAIHIMLGINGHYNAIEQAEGFVAKCENLKLGKCEFMAKYVKPNVQQGKYIKNDNGEQLEIHNFGYKTNDFKKYVEEYRIKFSSVGMDIEKMLNDYKTRINR